MLGSRRRCVGRRAGKDAIILAVIGLLLAGCATEPNALAETDGIPQLSSAPHRPVLPIDEATAFKWLKRGSDVLVGVAQAAAYIFVSPGGNVQ